MSIGPPPGAGPEAQTVARALRDLDHDRFIANLFAPQPARRHLNALFAFAAELAAVPARAREPAMGQMRLAWWRDTLALLAPGVRTGNPVADELAAALGAGGLAAAPLAAMIAARERELFDDPMAGLNDLEGHFGETVSAPIQCACLLLDPSAGAAEAAGHAGVALGLVELLTRWRGERRLAALVPADLLGVHGIGVEALAADPGGPGTAGLARDLVAHAGHHLACARQALTGAPATVLPAFLPLSAASLDLARLAARPAVPGVRAARWRRQLAMWRAARRGRV